MVVSSSPSHQQYTFSESTPQVTNSSVSSTPSKGCAKEGRIKAVEKGEAERELVEQDAKGQVRAVDMVILDEGSGVIPL